MNSTASRDYSLRQDLDAILTLAADDLRTLDGARIFMTGGTGFIGTWMLETFHHAIVQQGLALEIVILTRDPRRFAQKAPHLASQKRFQFMRGDVFNIPESEGVFSHVIHGATDASAALNESDPRRMFDTVLTGTRQALDLAVKKGARRFLHMSSGAVYGRQPWDLTHVGEDDRGAPDCMVPINAYGEAKRAAEMLCAIYGKQWGLAVSVARIFALLGPYLTLDVHFAAGNFIRDAMAGRTVTVQGDGRPCRSYLYAADLIVWMLALLVRGQSGRAYNVGSSESISIAELAGRISTLIGNGEVTILGSPDAGWNPGRYVPSTQAAERDLGLKRTVSLDEAICRTASWNGWSL
jgi:dTDP-glucose 4,6-dehydratase